MTGPGHVIPFLGKPRKPTISAAEVERYGRLIARHAAEVGISITINGPLHVPNGGLVSLNYLEQLKSASRQRHQASVDRLVALTKQMDGAQMDDLIEATHCLIRGRAGA